MTLESITCTHCGSSEVQEYKPGSFVCCYCDEVFKHSGPMRATVTQERAFCECGNAISFKCHRCGEGICEYHDLFRLAKGSFYYAGIGSSRGYAGEGENYLGVTDSHKRSRLTMPWTRWEKPIIEPVIPTLKIWRLISGDPSSDGQVDVPVHICVACSTVPAETLADELAAGAICTSWHCVHPATSECQCCGHFFCTSSDVVSRGDVTSDPLDISYGSSSRISIPVQLCEACREFCFNNPTPPRVLDAGVRRAKRREQRRYEELLEQSAQEWAEKVRSKLQAPPGTSCQGGWQRHGWGIPSSRETNAFRPAWMPSRTAGEANAAGGASR